MNISLLFQDLIKRGAKLWIEEEQLRCQGSGEVLTPEVLAILKQHKSEFLDLLREKTSEHDEYPLSLGQQALWFLHQNAKESAAYNIAAPLRIFSPLDVPAMKRTFQYLADRHPLLRAYFPVEDGKPLQKIRENQNVWFVIVDASDGSEEQLKQRVIQAYQQPFDLKTGPLFRINLFRRTDEDHVLLITVHHIVFDAWSGWLLMDEFSKLYSSITASQTSNLKPLQNSYRDYIQWQTEILAGAEGEKLWQYWQKKLAGEIPVLQLPTDRLRPPMQTFHGATIGFYIDETLTRQLRELAREEGTTLFTVLMAAFHVLLYRYTGQDDLLVGTPTGGRDNRDFTGISGYFVNPVVIRTDCAGKPTFRSFLRQVCDTVLEAIDHQDFPFPLLVERLQPKRSPGFSPLFQVDFTLQKAQVGDFTNLFDVTMETEVTTNWGDLKVKPFVIPQQEGQFDLTLEIIELENSLSGHFKYNNDLFDVDTIKRMAEHFEVLLRGIIQDPVQQITALPLLTQEEQQYLLEWNQTETVYPKDKTIVDLFQEQVEKTPDNIALVFEDRQLTYRELNQKANQLSHYLLSLKTDTDNSPLITGNRLVGICVERSLKMVIGLLGILKAGCAYVPLDPYYPLQRVQFMIEDSQVSMLLTQSHLQERLPTSQMKVIDLEKEWEQIEGYSDENPVRQSGPEDLAYVIYTSGSSGKPKGVMVEHRAFANFLLSMQQRVGLTSTGKLLALTTLSFDIAALELYLPLITGAQTILISRNTANNGESLAHKLVEAQITIMQATPATWKMLIQSGWHQVTPLTILCGGEALPPQLGQTLLKNSQQLWNVYGPTETTIWSTMHNVTLHQEKPELIGQPVANTHIYILDMNLNLTPPGIPGELCIAGAGLARGYLNRPELTREKFIEIELSGHCQRIYKTGDSARWLPDNTSDDANLEYLGRLDQQIKLRGFRIELGEIEAELSKHEAVGEAVVVLLDKVNDPCLAAFFTVTMPIDETVLNVSTLREHLRKMLPDYMIPSYFVQLEKIPLTSNGKTDKKALPNPKEAKIERGTGYIAPRDKLERKISLIWQEVLGIKNIGVQSKFFELGGHSLKAISIIHLIQKELGVELTLQTIFQDHTIEEIAAIIRDHGPKSYIPIEKFPPAEYCPVTHEQRRLWVLSHMEGGGFSFSIPLALELEGVVNLNAFEQSFKKLVKRHESLRTIFTTIDEEPVQKVLEELEFRVGYIDLSQDVNSEERATELADEDAVKPFDLTTGPLVRVTFLKTAKHTHVMLFNIHHIICDGRSLSILVRELGQLYNAIVKGKEDLLPPLRIQYRDYAIWQKKRLAAEAMNTHQRYWHEKLSGEIPVLNLPLDYSRPPLQTYNGDLEKFNIDHEKLEKLNTFSEEREVSLFTLFSALVKVLLYRYTGQEDIIVGCLVNGRNHADLEGQIGFYVKMLALRDQLNGESTFNDFLYQVNETIMEAYDHQDYPFVNLLKELDLSYDLSQPPLFNVHMISQNIEDIEISLEGVDIKPFEQKYPFCKFDLVFVLREEKANVQYRIKYNTDLFKKERIKRMGAHFSELMDSLLENPGLSLNRLNILPKAECRELL